MTAGGAARTLGHQFRDDALLRTALTHRSAGAGHNERLEFLGDAVLGFLVAEELVKRFPGAREGDLSRLRARLVRRETLAQVAQELGLGAQLHLGPGELKSGGHRRASILADALEALLAAVYLDAGLEACRARILDWFAPRFAQLRPGAALKDPKTQLQEYVQALHLALPEYRLVAAHEPPGGTPHFEVECCAAGVVPARATGTSRRSAEQAAAQRVLAQLAPGAQ